MTQYIAGQAITLTGTFYNAAGALATPSGATLYIRRHQSVRPLPPLVWGTDLGFTNPSPGVLRYTWVARQPGTYSYEWRSDDELPAVGLGTFTILPGVVAG